MKLSDIYVLIEEFDWISPDETCRVTFQVTRMLVDMSLGRLRYERITTPLDKDFANTWITPYREVDSKRVLELVNDPEGLSEPVLGVWWVDGSVLLIDGSHRYIARIMAGHTEIDYHLVALGDWQPYATITGELR